MTEENQPLVPVPPPPAPPAQQPQVTIQPSIPQHIANNILEFLRRVQSTGMEAIAWVEAYQFVQQSATQAQPGVPFGGLPPK